MRGVVLLETNGSLAARLDSGKAREIYRPWCQSKVRWFVKARFTGFGIQGRLSSILGGDMQGDMRGRDRGIGDVVYICFSAEHYPCMGDHVFFTRRAQLELHLVLMMMP